MNPSPEPLILVIGATGAQGGATAHRLLVHKHRVRILCRNPSAQSAQALVNAGAEVLPGNLDDIATVNTAMRGVSGVFSVQVPDVTGTDSERRHGLALVQAAINAGVKQFVHTSVTANGTHADFPRWGSGYWNEKYWTDKWAVEEAVITAGFPSWTVLRPAFIMENFIEPKVKHLFPDMRKGELATALQPGTRMQLISADDVGAFAHAAFDDPASFNRKTIELAAEALTMEQIASTLTAVLGKKVDAIPLSLEDALKRGLSPGWVRTQEFRNKVGYRVNLDDLKRYSIALESFGQWVRKHQAEIAIDT